MGVSLSFFGAAGTVTGSCYGITHPGGRFIVDCGLFQGNKTIRNLNYQDFPFVPDGLDFVLLTHAHIDHSGLVPKLVKRGFKGKAHATAATRDLLTFMLPDSGHIQETEVKRLNQRNRRRGRATVTPIYTRKDAEAALRQIDSQGFDTWFQPGDGIRARFWNAGHILGAASIEIEVANAGRAGEPLRILFSGDIGPQEKSFHDDPEAPHDLDYIVVESTYGDRDREDQTIDERREILRHEISEALKAGGNLLIPAFAVERTQELLFDIAVLMAEKKVPPVPVFLDSPLAVRATEVFEAHADALIDVRRAKGLFRQRNFTFVTDPDQSRKLADVTGGAIFIAASGMCEAGRIRHHLKNNLWRREATVLFVGYQAPGTLGQILLNGEKAVRINGEEIAVNARIRRMETYSAHADQRELVEWTCARLPVRQGIFLTHGENGALATFRSHLLDKGCSESQIFIPKLDETYDLVAEGRPEHRIETARTEEAEIKGKDWHNEYAALLLHLGKEIQALPNDAARHRLLGRVWTAVNAEE